MAQRLAPRREWIDPARTALLIIDMQADFAAPQGAMGRAGADLSAVPAALSAAAALAEAARAAGVRVIFVGLFTRPETDSAVWRERDRRLGAVPDEAPCRTGSAGSAFVGPRPAPGETVIEKTRYSAFLDGSLDTTLREAGLDTLVVCGLTTECCVHCTALDAYQRDYHVFIAADACAAYDSALHDGALAALAANGPILTQAAAVATAWAGSPAQAVSISRTA